MNLKQLTNALRENRHVLRLSTIFLTTISRYMSCFPPVVFDSILVPHISELREITPTVDLATLLEFYCES